MLHLGCINVAPCTLSVERSQSIVLYFSHCSNIVIAHVTIDRVFHNVQLYNICSHCRWVCALGSTNYSTCSGNSIVLYQYDSNLAKSSYFLNKSRIELTDITVTNNKSIYDQHLCLNDLTSLVCMGFHYNCLLTLQWLYIEWFSN